ncbi:hypothetical protein [Rhodobacter sp. CZR27]|uniref:hypothetical protein n=1 Tax=Rhodobacter sp. CZR27 TaxID=2033869 RepID=UPI000BBE6FC5|nr:hypothetical protein [Rhodobacter sp. CZR27]
MTKTALCLVATLAIGLAAQPLSAETSDGEKLAAALAILGIAALAHSEHHYSDGYRPESGEETAEFERGYRDGLHGYAYRPDNGTRGYEQGYSAGSRERENSMAHRRQPAHAKAPPMAIQGCARRVAQNFAVPVRDVHILRSQSPRKHEWQIETAVGHQHMVCKMRDTGEVLDLRGGRM